MSIDNTHGGSRGGGRPKSDHPKRNKNFRLPQDIILFIKSLPKGHRVGFVEDALSYWIQRHSKAMLSLSDAAKDAAKNIGALGEAIKSIQEQSKKEQDEKSND